MALVLLVRPELGRSSSGRVLSPHHLELAHRLVIVVGLRTSMAPHILRSAEVLNFVRLSFRDLLPRHCLLMQPIVHIPFGYFFAFHYFPRVLANGWLSLLLVVVPELLLHIGLPHSVLVRARIYPAFRTDKTLLLSYALVVPG